MAVGGATWGTAGALTLGAGNTFDQADATEDDMFDDQAWWTFTPTATTIIGLLPLEESTLRLFHGAEASKVEVFLFDGSTDTYMFVVNAGVTYHLLCGRSVFDSPGATYQITYTQQPTTATAWSTDWQDLPDHYIIVSGGSLRAANPSVQMQEPPDWVFDVVRTGMNRVGDYTAIQVLGGDPVENALTCCIMHARFGDGPEIQSWNNSTTGEVNDGDPTCRLILDGPSGDTISTGGGGAYSSETHPPSFPVGGFTNSTVRLASAGIWVYPFYENMTARGIFGTPQPEDYGAPPDAEIEWEGEDKPDLVSVEVTGDSSLGHATPIATRFSVNDRIRPTFSGGTWHAWQKGFMPAPPIVPEAGHTYYDFEMDSPAPVWRDLPELDAWDALTVDYANDTYDACVGVGPSPVWDGWTGSESGGSEGIVAVKVTIRSKRFRFIYPGSAAPAPVRVLQRQTDGLVSGGEQTIRRGTVQAGLRTIGSQK